MKRNLVADFEKLEAQCYPSGLEVASGQRFYQLPKGWFIQLRPEDVRTHSLSLFPRIRVNQSMPPDAIIFEGGPTVNYETEAVAYLVETMLGQLGAAPYILPREI